ncbi:MAG TPA: ATP-binding protein [Polyangiaceae bacterium]|nr:ATP-binding protein [Polyangiaceae bacterium]
MSLTRDIHSQTIASEGRPEQWSPNEAEAILLQLANAFITSNQLLREHPEARRGTPPNEANEAESTDSDADISPTEAGILSADARGIVFGVAGAACAMLGLGEQALIGSPLARHFVAPPTTSGRASLLRADGSTLEVSVTLARLPGSELSLLVLEDITERRARAQASKRAEARYRTLVEQIPAVTFMASLEDGDNDIYIGPQIESLLGYTQKEWLDDPVLWFHRMHPEDQGRWNAEFARGCAVGGPFRADCRFFARDGRTVWVHGEARVVRNNVGRPLFIQGVAFDITDLKDAESRLRQAQETLVRTEKLAAIGRLAASIGHELRNPLAAIRNAWYYLDRRLIQAPEAQTDKRVQQFSKVITSEIDRCAKIIGELLDFSRERAIYRAPTPVRELVQSALDVVVKPATTIMLLNHVSEDLPVPNVDADQCRQVLVNLLQNAAEAVDPQSGRVEVRASVASGELSLLVIDNGKGMSEDVRARIFEPLYTTKLRGTGLGLAIVEGIVKRHGGRISVSSVLLGGTTFAIVLPLGEASLEPAPDMGGAAELRPKAHEPPTS